MKKAILILMLAALLVGTIGCSATSRFYRMNAKEFHQIDYGYTVNFAQVRNIKIGYIDTGAGEETLFLIHGLGSNAKGWSRNIPVLARNFRVIAVDLPGYGYSQKEDYPYGLEFYADVLTQMLDELGIDKATWVGHSMGGQISIHAALKYPERVKNLILVAPAGIEEFNEGEKDWFRKVAVPELTEDASIRQIDINLKRNFYEYPEGAEFMVTDRVQVKGASDFEDYAYAVSRNIHAMVDEPTTDRLGYLTQPTLVIFGEQDGLIPNPYLHGGNSRDVGKKAERLIPGAKLMMVNKAGHFVQFEQDRVVNAAIIDFMYVN